LHIIFRGSTTKALGVTVLAFYPALLEKSGDVTFHWPLINCKSL